MKKINETELKKVQLEILDVVDDFCKKNHINYWLDAGTLLGCIRHKGYIPWDDDIDIGMLREDYNKFLLTFNEQNNRYRVISNELSFDCYYPYAKVLDTNTVLYEPDESGIKLSINIDVFVYDNAPDNPIECKKMYDKRDLYTLLNAGQFKVFSPKSLIKKFAKQMLYYFGLFFPKGYFSKQIVRNSKKYEDKKCNFVGNFTSFTRFICNKRVFDSFIIGIFEGKEYSIPVGYDEWLSSFYGDYMKLPPVEKRVSHHKFIAYMKG